MKKVLVVAHVVEVPLCEMMLLGLGDDFDVDVGDDAPGSMFIAKATPSTVAKDTAQTTRGRTGETPGRPLTRGDTLLHPVIRVPIKR